MPKWLEYNIVAVMILNVISLFLSMLTHSAFLTAVWFFSYPVALIGGGMILFWKRKD